MPKYAILRFEKHTLSVLHHEYTVPFMMSTIKRQAASCIFGLAPYIRDIIERTPVSKISKRKSAHRPKEVKANAFFEDMWLLSKVVKNNSYQTVMPSTKRDR